MIYDDIKRCGAIICRHISYPHHPILRATRDAPLIVEDSGWQFLCGDSIHNESDGAIWLLEEIAAIDASLQEILEADPGVSFERSTLNGVWISTSYTNDTVA